MTEGFIEKRRAPRVATDIPIQLTAPAEGSPGNLRDISTVGLCCEVAEPLQEMTVVSIELSLPGSDENHQVAGAVVRCDRAAARNKMAYEIAIYFTEISNSTRRAIGTYVEQCVADS